MVEVIYGNFSFESCVELNPQNAKTLKSSRPKYIMYYYCRPFVWGFPFLWTVDDCDDVIMMMMWESYQWAKIYQNFINIRVSEMGYVYLFVFELMSIQMAANDYICPFLHHGYSNCGTNSSFLPVFCIHTKQYFHWFFFLVVWVSISKVPFHRYGISIGVNICNQISIETFSLENSFDQHGNETIAPSPPKTFKIHSNKWICDYNKFRRIMINVTFTKVITRSQSSFSIYCSHVVIRHTITLWKLKRRKRTNEKKKTSNSLVKSFALCVTS